MKPIRMVSTLAAAAAVGVVATAVVGPQEATAAPIIGTSCSATGVSGKATWQFSGKTKLVHLRMTVKDTRADGHHVGIRLRTHDGKNRVRDWALHEEFRGKGASHTWSTSASLSAGIKKATVVVLTREGHSNVHGKVCGYVSNGAY